MLTAVEMLYTPVNWCVWFDCQPSPVVVRASDTPNWHWSTLLQYGSTGSLKGGHVCGCSLLLKIQL